MKTQLKCALGVALALISSLNTAMADESEQNGGYIKIEQPLIDGMLISSGTFRSTELTPSKECLDTLDDPRLPIAKPEKYKVQNPVIDYDAAKELAGLICKRYGYGKALDHRFKTVSVLELFGYYLGPSDKMFESIGKPIIVDGRDGREIIGMDHVEPFTVERSSVTKSLFGGGLPGISYTAQCSFSTVTLNTAVYFSKVFCERN